MANYELQKVAVFRRNRVHQYLHTQLLLALFLSFYLLSAQSISLENIWTQHAFYPERMYNLKALKKTPQYTVLEYNRDKHIQEINLYDFATLSKVQTLFETNERVNRIESYEFSPDEKKLLIATRKEDIYRHSFIADYFLYDLATGDLKKVSDKRIQVPTFSPNGKQLAFVYENNLYLYDLTTGAETQITTDGQKNAIINGTADWVYEEEFGIVRLFAWNADGTQLAFIRSDERKVPEFSMDIYGYDLYPTPYTFKYPKAGEANSAVSLHIYTVADKSVAEIPLKAYYIPRLQWTNDPHKLTVQTLNRHQNDWQLLQVDSQTKATTSLVKETSTTYVSINKEILFLPDNSFIYQSEKDGNNHFYYCNAKGKLVRQLTRGNWEVTDCYGYDPKTQQLFYQSTQTGSTRRGLYAVNLKGKAPRALSTEAGTNKGTFSGDFSMYIHAFANATTPPRYTLNDTKSGKQLKEIVTNAEYAQRLKAYNLPEKEFMELKTAKGTFNAYMLNPKDFDPKKQYPLLMYQYSGPGSQEVADQWWDMNDFWHAMLTQKGYIVLCVDGRGTGYKGADFKKCTYQQLGKYEVEDQADVAQLVGTYSYIDKSRIGIWGWSFGGFMSSNCLFQKGDIFKMAIAVAPVTNWRFYDTIYTERFMRTPQENAKGYDENSPLFHAAKLKGKYLLIHGSADDNVHVQNAMVLINTLVSLQKDFDWLIYPDKNHGIYDNTGSTRYQLYTKMTNFIIENL